MGQYAELKKTLRKQYMGGSRKALLMARFSRADGYDIYRFLPPDVQVVVVSATLPHEVLEITTKFMSDPVRILVKRDEITLELELLSIIT